MTIPTRRLVSGALSALALVAAVVGVPATAAAMLAPTSLEQLARMSDTITLGTVTATASRRVTSGAEQGLIVTDATIAVERVLKGTASARVTFMGGTFGGVTLRIDEAPDLVVGERCLVFADARGRLVSGRLGALTVSGEDVPAAGLTLAATEARIVAADQTATAAESAPLDPAAVAPARMRAAVWAAAAPAIATITPAGRNAGTDSTVTIAGSGFGTATGTVSFAYDGSDRTDATVVSWSDAAVVAVVPAYSSSGDVWVTPSAGFGTATRDYTVGYSYEGHRWPLRLGGLAPQMAYRVNANWPGATDELAAVQAAAAMWSAPSAFSFTYAGPCSASANYPSDNGHNDINWATGFPSSNMLAYNSVKTADGNPSVLESDIIINADVPWGDGTGGTWDIQTVVGHELGHAVSLLDQYGTSDRGKLMYGAIGSGTLKRSLSAYELAALHDLYGEATVTPPPSGPTTTSVSIVAAPASVRLPRPFVLSGVVTGTHAGDIASVEVRKPGSGRWSYSSARGVSASDAWWYRYTPKLRGTYAFRTRFAADATRLASVSGVVSVSVR